MRAMGSIKRPAPALHDTDPGPTSACDVLVIGAGWAGIQAASAAAERGARVLLVDTLAQAELQARMPDAAALCPWLSSDGAFVPGQLGLRPGHTALELMIDASSGRVCGAIGVAGKEEAPWRVEAAAVVIASTEALLMAAEAGAELCGMEDGQGGMRICGPGSGGAGSVEGLYAAGKAAWSPSTHGAGLPRGTQAQALLSGQQAGAAAAQDARMSERRPGAPLRRAGGTGLRGPGHRPANPDATLAALRAILRGLGGPAPDDARTIEALERLDALWLFIGNAAPASRGALCATRAAACQVALARWQLRSLLARRASERAHLARECVVARGVDEVCTSTEPTALIGRPVRTALAPDLLGLGLFAI